eukprot:scaffold6162_cov154-Cylindrotheca_fusiformis.AAC.14
MSSLDGLLRFESQPNSLGAGESPLHSAIRPTASGLNWLAVPSSLPGLAYRVCRGNTLERLSVGDAEVEITASATTTTTTGVVNIASSFDGRLVAVACLDGSVQCFDSTTTKLSHRWTIPNCHSHMTSGIDSVVSSDRSKAAGASGPIRSFAFGPKGYELLLVDSSRGSLSIFNAAMSRPTPNTLAQTKVSSATWALTASSNTNDAMKELAVGKEDGTIELFQYQSSEFKSLRILDCPNGEDGDGLVCTHVDWSEDSLLAGFCRVDVSEDPPDEDDEDDTAEHEAFVYMTSVDINSSYSNTVWQDLGDVVAFFSVPKSGRHAYFTSFVRSSKQTMCAVAANVGTDVGVLAKDDQDGTWAIVELEDGAEPTTPTNDEDEFTYPVGIAVVTTFGSIQLLLPATDGSLSVFSFQHESEPNYFQPVAPLVSTSGVVDSPVDTVESSEPPELEDEPREEPEPDSASSGFSFGGGSSNPGSLFGSTAKPSFGVGSTASASFAFGSGSASGPTFGGSSSTSGTTFGATFGTPSKLGGSAFGQTSTLGGGDSSTPPTAFGGGGSLFGSSTTPFGGGSKAPTFGSAATTGGSIFGSASNTSAGGFAALSAAPASDQFRAFAKPITPEGSVPSSMIKPLFGSKTEEKAKTPNETSKLSIFGSGAPASSQSTSTPKKEQPSNANTTVFGSGSKAPSFSFAAPTTPFSFAAPAGSTVPSPFAAFSSNASSPSTGFEAKPLFSTKTQTPEKKTGSVPESNAIAESIPPTLSAAGKRASRVYDEFHIPNNGSLPIKCFEELIDDLGEGFHGAELDKQIQLIDPTKLGTFSRASFIDWYSNLVEGDGGDGSSIDSDERADREEERQKAKKAFETLAADSNTIPVSEFGRLIESMNTVYCEEEHRNTQKKLEKPGGVIHKSDFLAWYIDWLFRGDESSDEEAEDDDEKGLASGGGAETPSNVALDNFFTVDKDSWKCDICSVRNDKDLKKCAACETPRPGFESETPSGKGGDGSGSAIDSGGFSFGGGSGSSGAIGSSGFTFGTAPAPTPAEESKTGESKGGFTFGSTATASPSPFSFGAPKSDSDSMPKADSGLPVTESGFTFKLPRDASPNAGKTGEEIVTEGGFKFKAGHSAPKPTAVVSESSPARIKASEVFDELDEAKKGSLPIDSFEDLVDELGE